MEIRLIEAHQTYNLRKEVMNPELSLNETARPGDEVAIHFGIYQEVDHLGVISLYPQDQDENYSESIWRIRGMAILNNHQGKGIGKKLMEYAFDHLKDNFELKSIWCNARESAIGFYLNYGFEKVSEQYVEFPHPGVRARLVLTFP